MSWSHVNYSHASRYQSDKLDALTQPLSEPPIAQFLSPTVRGISCSDMMTHRPLLPLKAAQIVSSRAKVVLAALESGMELRISLPSF